MKNKKIYLIFGVLAIIIIAGIFLQPKNDNAKNNTTSIGSQSKKLIPVDTVTHGHGLATDPNDPMKLYIATHEGLFVLVNEKQLYRVGDSRDDYMGFSSHPKDPKILFTSGHPVGGGNVGFQKSEDGGFSWTKLADGVDGPVDFHAMSVSPANPDVVYGWYRGALQRTTDGGKTWVIVGKTKFVVVGLTADPKDENVLYAVSPQGLFVTRGKGSSWNRLMEGFVSAVGVSPSDSQSLLSFSEQQRLAKSNDGGKTWQKMDESFNGEVPLFIAFQRQNPKIVYTLTEKNSIYKSIDSGTNWNKIH